MINPYQQLQACHGRSTSNPHNGLGNPTKDNVEKSLSNYQIAFIKYARAMVQHLVVGSTLACHRDSDRTCRDRCAT